MIGLKKYKIYIWWRPNFISIILVFYFKTFSDCFVYLVILFDFT